MIIFNSNKCVRYAHAGHPESPQRVSNTVRVLISNGYNFKSPEKAAYNEVLLAHSPQHLENLMRGDFHDEDSPSFPQIYDLALLSAGSAVQALKLSLTTPENSFSLMRPPGHHSGTERVMGFCYLNNVAIAALNALKLPNIKRIAILDIDNHYGNGTQEIVKGMPGIIHVDLHCAPDFPNVPYTSAENCFNYQLPHGTTEEAYLRELDKGLARIANFNPEGVVVSAGFDTFEKDPVGNLKLEIPSFRKIGERIKALGKPVCSVLEGGYNPDDLPSCILSYLQGIN
jgi:acetoin utilization deacetylase AcuC-like enzyme